MGVYTYTHTHTQKNSNKYMLSIAFSSAIYHAGNSGRCFLDLGDIMTNTAVFALKELIFQQRKYEKSKLIGDKD